MKLVRNRLHFLVASLVLLSAFSISSVASALATVTKASAPAAETKRVQTIITKGSQEIDRRITTLNTLTNKITAATKLTAADKASIAAQVSTEITSLTALKTKLAADTTLADAKADAQSIYTDYRVYALIVPKVRLVKTADDQQVVEVKLTALAAKLQTRLTSAKAAGKDTTSLQAQLDDLNAKVSAAQAISASIESKVIALQPSDYDSNHAVLSGDADQLKTAHSDNQAALTDAKAIVSGLKNL